MISATVKLKLTQSQEALVEEWLWHLTGAYNWTIRKIELDGQDGIYHSKFELQALVNGHGQRIGIPSHVLRGMVTAGFNAWTRCYKGLAGTPKLKGQRNRLNYIVFPDPTNLVDNQIRLRGLGLARIHKQSLPPGRIKCCSLMRRPSGWYLRLSIDSEIPAIPALSSGWIGIDPGFANLISLSNGEQVSHPRELEIMAEQLARSQRANNRRQAARIQERIANQRKDRNHKLSRRLVEENQVIAFSKDNIKGLARTFGKSVASSSHSQLRSMLAYKCRAGGRQYIEVPSRNSTKTCSACGSLSGPTGYAGLKVRHWQCDACGADHDRDINAAINTLIVGLGLSHERYREIASENLRRVS